MANGKAGSSKDSAPALYEAGLRHFHSGRLAVAEDRCRKALASDPEHADTLHLLGLIHAKGHRVDLAIDFIAQAIRSNQGNADYFSNLGSLLVLRNQFEQALKSYDLALKLKPDLVNVWIRLGDLLQKQNRDDEALLTFDHALKLDPDNIEAADKSGLLLLALGRREEALAVYGRLVEIAPDNYEGLNSLGNVLLDLRRYDEATVQFERAIALRPDLLPAFNNLGLALIHLRRFDDAVRRLGQAMALSSDVPELYSNRGAALKKLGRLDEALWDYDRAIALKPDYALAHGNRGICLDDLARPDEAEASFRRALALDPDHGDSHWSLAVNRLRAGDLRTGWIESEWRWKSVSLGLTERVFDQPLWLGAEPIDGKTLLVHCEQGLGDAIQFCRYVPLLAARGARVILQVDQPLKELLSGVDGVAQCLAKGEVLPDFDLHCPLLSLPLAFDTTLATIPDHVPYIPLAKPARDWTDWLGAPASGPIPTFACLCSGHLCECWNRRTTSQNIDSSGALDLTFALRARGLQGSERQIRSTRPRIGLVWSGNPDHLNDHNRSVPLQKLLPLLEVEAEFISLQKGARARDRALLAERRDIRDAEGELASFADTASLIAELDLVISVDTSVAHLAGSLGKPVWVLLPYVPDWRWLLNREDSPWYPTARLFRQSETRQWDVVMANVQKALRAFVAEARKN
jgi:tetratricopeptide (TPR) repeat protein